MKVFVIGANGRTGREIVELARARGHQITAFVRSPETLAQVPATRVVRGDPQVADSIAQALPGHDAVLSAIGPHLRDAFRPHTLLADCARATVDAMTGGGVGRLAIVSAAVLFPEKGLEFAFFRWLLRHHARDLREMERIVRTSNLAWTIARPPRLTQSHEVNFVTARDAMPKGGRVMSFRSVAWFMLDAIEERSHVGEIVGLAPDPSSRLRVSARGPKMKVAS